MQKSFVKRQVWTETGLPVCGCFSFEGMGEIIKLAVEGSNPINSSHALGVPESGATSEGSHLSGPERVMKVSHTLQAYLP